MFALMVPVIITGAWAEKFPFSAYLMFITIWPFLVYYPVAHWVWAAKANLENTYAQLSNLRSLFFVKLKLKSAQTERKSYTLRQQLNGGPGSGDG